jgi:hypothetical protein
MPADAGFVTGRSNRLYSRAACATTMILLAGCGIDLDKLVATVAPRGEIARRLLATAIGRIHAEAGAEREMLDIERDIEGEPLRSRPSVVRPLGDRRIGVWVWPGSFSIGMLRVCRLLLLT